jgi:hypothetical protein
MILRVNPSQKPLAPFAVLVVAQSRKRRLRRGPTFRFFVVFVFGNRRPVAYLRMCLRTAGPVLTQIRLRQHHLPRQYHVSATEPMVLDRYRVFHII